MKKYRICLFLLVFTSIVCFAAGYGLTKYRESREETEESRTLPAQTVQEDFLAESETEQTQAREANQEPENNYYLVCEDGFLLVFCGDRATVCLYTHVPITDFPEEEQGKLRSGIWFSSMMDIFSYLESYTS